MEEKQFPVIGIEVRTNNSREASGEGEIHKQWEKFFKEGILERIPDRLTSEIVVVYSNYQSDRHGDYDYLIGAKVNDASKAPSGMVVKKVPTGKYAIFTAEPGPVAKVVPEQWQEIGAWRTNRNSEE